jgi:glyoxylase-like metal-dependent hydrolase (beta-lactamase superfamily II)
MPDLIYPFPAGPEPGHAIEIQDGIFWLALPLPFALGHINVWLLDEGDNWALIDTGPAVAETIAAWEHILSSLVIKGKPVGRIYITHHHPDHVGLASWLSGKYSSRLYMSAPTRDRVRYLLQDDISDATDVVAAFYQAHGIDDPLNFVQFETGRKYRKIVSGLPDNINLIEDNAELEIGGRKWQAMLCHGHAAGHIALYSGVSELLISGDQILPAITCNISLISADAGGSPLHDYLESLQRFQMLPESTLVMPSHGKVFSGLHRRLEQIRTDHQYRLDTVEKICKIPRDAAEVTALLFPRRLDELNGMLAFGETLAHLRFLAGEHRLQCREHNGKYYFQH